jgi:protein-S-isoprenylcysteine O-methyltransferase Ste14
MLTSSVRFAPYLAHFLFWLPYLIRGQVDRMRGRADGPPVHAAPGARALIVRHSVATLGMYLGIGAGVFSTPTGVLSGPMAWSGLAMIGIGGLLSMWTLWVFRSWKLRAELHDAHELCLDGPFRVVRHPIYTAMIMLAVGTFLWIPNGLTLGGMLGIAWVGDQRARAEEQILLAAFGERYSAFMASTKRFFPGVY